MNRLPATPRHALAWSALVFCCLSYAAPAAYAQGIAIPAPAPAPTPEQTPRSLPERVSEELRAARFDLAIDLVEKEATSRSTNGAPDWAIREADQLRSELARLRDFDSEQRRQVVEAEELAARAGDAFRSRDLGVAIAASEGSYAQFETLWPETSRLARLALLRARILAAAGRGSEALELAGAARALLDPKVGALAPESIRQRAVAGQCHRELGALREADVHLREAFESARDHHASDPRFALSFALPYAAFLFATDRWTRATSIVSSTLETAREAFGEDDELTVGARALLGAVFRAQGRRHEAEPHLALVYETRRLRLGAPHPATVAAGLDLVSLWIDRQRWDRATTIAERLVRSVTATPQLEPLLPTVLRRLATAQAGTGKTQEREAAISHLERAERVAEKLGQTDERVLAALALARLAPENEAAFLRARQFSGQLPEDSPLRFAIALAAADRNLEAKVDHAEMLRFARERFGESHPLTLRAGIELARAQLRVGQLEIAAATVERLIRDTLSASAIAPPSADGVAEVVRRRSILRDVRTLAMRVAVARDAYGEQEVLEVLRDRAPRSRLRQSFAGKPGESRNAGPAKHVIQAEEEQRFLYRTAAPTDRAAARADLLTMRARTWESLLPEGRPERRVDLAPNTTEVEIAFDDDQVIVSITDVELGRPRGWVLADGPAAVSHWRRDWSRLAARLRAPHSKLDTLLRAHRSLLFSEELDLEFAPTHEYRFRVDDRLEAISFSLATSPARASILLDPDPDVNAEPCGAPRAIVVANRLQPEADAESQEPPPSGVLVRRVEAGSNAHRAGLRAGDLFQNYAGHEIGDLEDLDRAIRSVREEVAAGRIGSEARVELGYWRNGQSHRGSIALGRFGVRFDPSPPADVLRLLAQRSVDFELAVTRVRDGDFDQRPSHLPHVWNDVSLLRRTVGVSHTVLEDASLGRIRGVHRSVATMNFDTPSNFDIPSRGTDETPCVVWILEVPTVHPTPEQPIGALQIGNENQRWLHTDQELEWTSESPSPPRVVVLSGSQEAKGVAQLDLARPWLRLGSDVIMELWPSSSYARAFLLNRFLAALEGRTPGHALEIARSELRTATLDTVATTLGLTDEERRVVPGSADAPFDDSRYWAGWVIVHGRVSE